MARRNRDDDLLLEEDELTAAFLGDEAALPTEPQAQAQAAAPTAEDEWNEDGNVPEQLGDDVYETKGKLVVKDRTESVYMKNLDVYISHNKLTLKGS